MMTINAVVSSGFSPLRAVHGRDAAASDHDHPGGRRFFARCVHRDQHGGLAEVEPAQMSGPDAVSVNQQLACRPASPSRGVGGNDAMVASRDRIERGVFAPAFSWSR